jgi:hypothetical protein
MAPHHHIYAIIEERFLVKNENVVKFGIVNDISKLGNAYVVGVIYIKSHNVDVAKASLLSAARSMFTPTSYGDDYFIGERGDMLDLINKIAMEYM